VGCSPARERVVRVWGVRWTSPGSRWVCLVRTRRCAPGVINSKSNDIWQVLDERLETCHEHAAGTREARGICAGTGTNTTATFEVR
jgi:hypothetical protein